MKELSGGDNKTRSVSKSKKACNNSYLRSFLHSKQKDRHGTNLALPLSQLGSVTCCPDSHKSAHSTLEVIHIGLQIGHQRSDTLRRLPMLAGTRQVFLFGEPFEDGDNRAVQRTLDCRLWLDATYSRSPLESTQSTRRSMCDFF